MGTIYKRGRNWYIDVRVKRRRIRRKVGASKKLAELALKDAEVKIARDEFGFGRNDIAIDNFLVHFLEYSRTNHQPRTTARYRAVVDHFQAFLQRLSSVTFISEITTEVIDRYKVYRRDALVNPNGHPLPDDAHITQHTRRGARAHTINFEIGTLKTILNLAIKWGYLKENPTKGVTKLKVNDAKPPRFLTKEECKQLLDTCSTELYPIYFTYLNTGMRKAELENLEWDDVDFGKRKLKIRRKADWQPRTGEREIPMSDAVLDLFTHMRQVRDKKAGRYVFCSPDGGRMKTKVREKLIQIAKQAGIEGLTKVHTLRHTFASHLMMSGVDLPTVQKLMGHSDIQTTMIYAHLATDHLADAVNKLPFN